MAITGGIAEGKSTVLQWLKEDGFSVYSSDEAAKTLMADSKVRIHVAELAGLPPDFDPRHLRSVMLADSQIRRNINRYLHPLIGEVNRSTHADFFEVPLLIEACLYNDYDQVWVVTCGAEEQTRRLMDRLGDVDLVRALLQIQLTPDTKCQFADVIMRTNGDLEAVRLALRFTVSGMRSTFLCSS